jgi:DHA2 family metal-tetracycline-proton antiporter-like MFS transporter
MRNLTGGPHRVDEGTAANPAKGIVIVVCIAMFFGVLNASAVGVVLPEIAVALSVDTAQLAWLMTGFLLIYGIAIPFYGRLADRYGAGRLFVFGVVVFSVGSVLSAVAPNYEFLFLARIVQALGGAAVPGLGMTLASRAYGPESRGMVLGMVAATIGVGSAIGPLLGGVLSELMGWRSIFFVTSAALLTIPFTVKALPKDEERVEGNLDLIGGAGLGLMVAGILLVPSEGARSGWTSGLVIAGGVAGVVGLAVLAGRQLFATAPFIHRELLRNLRFLALAGMSFTLMAANLAPLIGLPILLAISHGLSPLEIGLVMVPGAALSAVSGILSGKLTDRTGPSLPVRIGSPIMLVALFGLSAYSGSSPWAIAGFAGLLGAGFGFVNTPLAATISRLVSGQMLASALSMNSMLFFLGGSFGTAIFMALVSSSGLADGSLNPVHSGFGNGFSDGFLLLMIPVLLAMGLSLALPAISKPETSSQDEEPPLEVRLINRWTPDCSVPWHPECVEMLPAVATVDGD